MTDLTLTPYRFALVRTVTYEWVVAPDGDAHPMLLDNIKAGFFPWPRRVRGLEFSGNGRVVIESGVTCLAGEIPTVARFHLEGDVGTTVVGYFLCES